MILVPADSSPEQFDLSSRDRWEVVVIGAGAAGLMAAIRAAERGKRTLVVEKNDRPGVKILMSGGTRCNLTQNTNNRGIVKAFGASGSFLHSALARLSPQQLVELVEAEGVATKVEETGKIFPVSNQATDVLAAFTGRLQRSGAALALGEPIVELERDEQQWLLRTNRRTLTAAHVILTTGGQSYPGSGTTGDGYRFAAACGHTIVPPRPALVPITTEAPWVRDLKGITLPHVGVRVLDPGTDAMPESTGADKTVCLAQRQGSLLFAHFGLSGPVVLDVSREVSGHAEPRRLWLECDFLPECKDQLLDEQLRQQAAAAGKKQIIALLPESLPRRVAETLVRQAGLDPTHKGAELSKLSRLKLVQWVKHARIRISGTMGFKKAEVTAGGVSLDEVDSRTMQSKLAPGLYLAGEVLDLDGPIGGYNFQAAFSTGCLAGESV
jgi:predicted Rossmann fold flavoprotein